jgi:hypothetical protein
MQGKMGGFFQNIYKKKLYLPTLFFNLVAGNRYILLCHFLKSFAINRSILSTFSYTNDIMTSKVYCWIWIKFFIISYFFAVIVFNLNYRVRNIGFIYCSATSIDISLIYVYPRDDIQVNFFLLL